MPKGFANLLILLGITIFILIGGAMVYQKVLAPRIQPTPGPTISPSPILTSIITNVPSSISQPSPTPDPTTGWKVYKSDFYTLRYPPNWEGRRVPGASGTIFVPSENGKYFLGVGPLDINRKQLEEINYGETSTIEAKTILVNGHRILQRVEERQIISYIEGVAENVTFGDTGETKRIEGILQIYLYNNGADSVLQYLPLINQILSTFKFLN